ncbi:hypothetical protein L1785_08645 [Antribacter sp. KLBMP9083]|uniref:Uncharacterized protein n=1 Tax=Antribacter soli TaxID=2910976 RepID=A0AA41UBF7_9MICO|nr:hypothetical protein [Antribacter soli]MCF4121049.1 hypothetical protein [Antribacter soli]
MSTTSTQGAGTTEADGQAWSWTVDPVAGWVVVPSTTSESPEVISSWESDVVEAVLGSVEPGTPEGSDGGVVLSDEDRALLRQNVGLAVANLLKFADHVAPDARIAALVGLEDRGPVPVVVSVVMGEPGASDDTLLEVLGATGGNPVNPPNIEYFELPDGDGIRVTRLDLDQATGGVWLSVGVGRRTEHPDAVVDTVLLWRTQDIITVEAVGEALDELLPAVRVTRSAQ